MNLLFEMRCDDFTTDLQIGQDATFSDVVLN